MFFLKQDSSFEMDMCSECTQKLVKKVGENRKRTDGEDGRQQDDE